MDHTPVRIIPGVKAAYSWHILSRIYNCTKAGNRRTKRGGPRKSEGGVRVKLSEADAFTDFRTRFCYSGIMISKFYCLTSISPKDNIQFEGLHHKVGNKE